MDRTLRNDRFHVYDAYNPTIGTPLAMAVKTAFDPLSALVSHWNPGNSQMYAVPMRLRLRVGAAGTGTTALHVALLQDTVTRWASAGSLLANADRKVSGPRASTAEVRFGALVMAAAGGGAQRLAHRVVKSAALAVGDTFTFDFDEYRAGVELGKVVVAPGDNLVLHAWTPGATVAPTFEAHWQWREVLKRN